MDVHLGLDNGNHARRKHCVGNVELIVDNPRNPRGIGVMDHRTFLRSIDPQRFGHSQRIGQIWDLFHQLNAVNFVFQAFVNLEKRRHAQIFPQICRHLLAVDAFVHGPLKQDRADDFFRREFRCLDDPRAHSLHFGKHFRIVRIGIRLDAIERQGLGRRAPALIERCDKALSVLHLKAHLIKIRHPVSFDSALALFYPMIRARP